MSLQDPSLSIKVPALVTTGLIVVCTIFPLLSLLAIVTRLKARKVARQPLQADDWFVFGSWVFAFSLSIDIWYYGSVMGIDYFKIGAVEGVQASLKCILIASTLVQSALALVKISILLFYKRIFTTPKFRIAIWIGIVVVAFWGVLFTILVLVEIDPFSGTWTGEGKARFNTAALGLAQVGTSIALDVVVLTFPIPVIATLHMPRQRKVAVGMIFWLGSFCVVAAIVRTILLHASIEEVVNSPGFGAVASQHKQFIFMIIEAHCSIIAACLPCFGPLFTGGRAPESLVRSVRSVLSLASRSSLKKDTTRKNGSINGSNIELTPYSNSGGKVVSVGRISNQIDEEMGIYPQQGISLTKVVDITRN